MSTFTNTDPDVFGGELAKAIRRYGELQEQDGEAQQRLALAAKAVTDAEASSIAQAAAARVAGAAEPGDDTEREARETYELATREAAISRAAVQQAGEAIENEAVTNGDAYRARLSKRIEAAQKTGQNSLHKLEEALQEIRVVRAFQTWLNDPQCKREPQAREMFAAESPIRLASGEPVVVSSLTGALHDVLNRPTHRTGDQRGHGLTVGAVKEAA